MEVLAVSLGLLFFGFLGVVRPLVNRHLYREYLKEVYRWQMFHLRWQQDLYGMGERWAHEDLILVAGGHQPRGLPYGSQAQTVDAYWEIMLDAPVRVESWETRKAEKWAKQLEAVS